MDMEENLLLVYAFYGFKFVTLWQTNIAMEHHHFQWENPL